MRQLAQLRLPLPASALRALLADTLASGASLEQLALALQISVSQLRSGLRSQGLNFSQLLDQAREARAMVLLANPAFSLEQIAIKLGFSSSSSFNRAFRRWKGDTPLNYRRQVLG
ncbi:HTH-type transcriptional regulator VirS [compost metagenome]